jgi:2-phosphoglycerate kinase
MKKILLIGGAPGTGKTTLTKSIAQETRITWISTDQIRTMLNTIEADKPTGLLQDELERYERIWRGAAALIHGIDPWGDSVIEGSVILPHLVARDFAEFEEAKAIFLVFETKEEIKKIIEERSKLSWIKTKTPEQQAAKVEQTWELNEKIKEDAKTHSFPIFTTQNLPDDKGIFNTFWK